MGKATFEGPNCASVYSLSSILACSLFRFEYRPRSRNAGLRVRIRARRAALDDIGQRLGRRAGDVDAVGAQVGDHARARLRLVQLGRQLGRAVPAGVRAVGKRAKLDELERLAQPGEIDPGRGLELGTRRSASVSIRAASVRRRRFRRARQRGTVSGARGANSGRVQLPSLAQREMFAPATPVRLEISR